MNPNTLQPDDYATEQQIARNHERLKKLRAPQTGNLLAQWESEQQAAEDAAFEARQVRRARGDDLPLFALE